MAIRSRCWEAQTLSTTYTRAGIGAVHRSDSREPPTSSATRRSSRTRCRGRTGKHYLRFGGSVIHHTSGGTGSEPGTAILGTFTFKNTTTAPFDQLTLADVQNYTQPINFGISSYKLKQWLYTGFVQDSIHLRRDLTIDLGLRYDRQTLTDAKKELRAARRLRLASGGRFAHGRFAAATACITRRFNPIWSPATW